MTATPTGRPKLLVLGDWTFDENWVAAPHPSTTSSIEGRSHLAAFGDPLARQSNFCGAGRVARMLYWMGRFDKQGGLRASGDASWFDIFGLGLWAPADEVRLFSLFHPDYRVGQNLFTLCSLGAADSPNRLEELGGLYLSSLASVYAKHEGKATASRVGTTRVIRLYQDDPSRDQRLDLKTRIDFESGPLEYRDKVEAQPEKRRCAEFHTVFAGLARAVSEPQFLDVYRSRAAAFHQLYRLYCGLDEPPSEAELKRLKDALSKLKTAAPREVRLKDCQAAPQDCPAGSKDVPAFEYVVVKDLGKGTMQKGLVECLKRFGFIGGQTKWYVTSKIPCPEWLSALRDSDAFGTLELLFLPPKAIEQAYLGIDRDRRNEAAGINWFMDKGQPTKDALEALKFFANGASGTSCRTCGGDATPGVVPQPQLLVAMPEGLRLLACRRNEDGMLEGFRNHDRIIPEPKQALIGRASMFFSALTAKLIGGGGVQVSTKELLLAMDTAIAATEDYLDSALSVLSAQAEHHPRDAQKKHDRDPIWFRPELDYDKPRASAGGEGKAEAHPFKRYTESFDWQPALEEWDATLSRTGILNLDSKDKSPTLEIWRSMQDLAGYASVEDGVRAELRRLRAAVKDFAKHPPDRSRSAYISARPGAGKSYLASRLAKETALQPLWFNVVQCATRESIVDTFDEIASAQAHSRNTRYLVFFDEIDAPLGTKKVFDIFLSVIEDGSYRIRGRAHKLDPCFWLFAGTTTLLENRQDKMSDFYSRLTEGQFDFHVRRTDVAAEGAMPQEGVRPQERLNQLYVAAAQLAGLHPHITEVECQVLQAFYYLTAADSLPHRAGWSGRAGAEQFLRDLPSARRIRQLVQSVRTVRRGLLTLDDFTPISRDVLTLAGKRAADDASLLSEWPKPDTRVRLVR